MERLTDEQVKNWRTVMSVLIGPYALIMPKDEIEDMRKKMQKQVEGD